MVIRSTYVILLLFIAVVFSASGRIEDFVHIKVALTKYIPYLVMKK